MMSNLINHAQTEMNRAGLFEEDADYGGAHAKAVMDLIELFASQQHSGMSAAITLGIFSKLARFEPLTPITSDPEEWEDVSEQSGYALWQNKRQSTSFSEDGGKTWYDIEDRSRDNGASCHGLSAADGGETS